MPIASVTTTSTYTLANIVAQGRFLTIHPETMLRLPGRHPSLVSLPVPLLQATHPIGLIQLRDRTPSPIASVFVREVRAVAKAAGLGRRRAAVGAAADSAPQPQPPSGVSVP
jgi:DNA-binding transcriptional LysR family regulator